MKHGEKYENISGVRNRIEINDQIDEERNGARCTDRKYSGKER